MQSHQHGPNDRSCFMVQAGTKQPRTLESLTNVQTEWAVLTGGPSSGKSTLLAALGDRGIQTSTEIAREFISERMAKGMTLDDIRSDAHGLQMAILEHSIQRVLDLEPSNLVIFDRGLPDAVAYQNLSGLDVEAAHRASTHVRYKRVFVLESVGLQHDEVRNESPEMVKRIEAEIIRTYTSFGYELTHIPAVSVEERVRMVLEAFGR